MDTVEKSKTVNLPKQKMSKKNKIIIIVSAIVALMIGLFIFVNVVTSAPAKISEELIADIQALDSTAAYDLMSADAQNVTSTSDFKDAIDRVGPILNGKPSFVSKEVSAETGSHNKATVIYDIAGSDNNTYRFTVKLTENDGKWQVDTFLSEKK